MRGPGHRATRARVRRRGRRRVRWPLVACAVVLLAQVALLVALTHDDGTGRLHDVPVDVVAPGVVAGSLTSRIDDLPGRMFDARAQTSADLARRHVARGTVVASLEVDLAGTRDVLVLNGSRDRGLNTAVASRIRAVERAYGRTGTITTATTTTTTGASSSGPGEPHASRLTLAASVAGFVLVLVMSLLRGPVATSPRSSARRTAVVVAGSLLLGTALVLAPFTSVGGPGPVSIAIAALGVLAAATTTLALEALFGLAGLVVAVSTFLVLATPLLTRTDAYLLPQPWPDVARWTPTGALHDAISAVASFGGTGVLAPVLVGSAWVLVSFALIVVARRVRSAAGVVLAPVGRHGARARRRGAPVLWRLRVVAAVTPLVVVVAVAVAAVPAVSTRAAALPSASASASPCLPTGPVSTVDDVNRLVSTVRGGSAFRGGDVGADVRLQDGRRLWVFADTLGGDASTGSTFVRNSMLVIGPSCIQVVLPPGGGALIPDRATRASGAGKPVGYWPMSIGRVQRPGYDLVSVLTQRVRTVGSGAFGFENLGPSVAVFIVPRGATPQLIAQRDIGPDDPARSRPEWGAAATVVDGDHGRWVYLYGTATPDAGDVVGYSLRVARVRPDDILDATRWRYWDGTAWQRDPGRAKVLIGARNGVSQTLSVFEQGGTWYALSKQGEFVGSDLTVWTAPSPNGPFTVQPPLARLPSDAVTGMLSYMPLAHPDLLGEPGTMVVSYSRNSTDLGAVVKNPLLYRPYFLRVRLPRPGR